MKRAIKGVLGRLAFATGLYRLFFRDKAVIVLFHRVDDRYAGTPITCGVTEFERYCAFFRRYFTVVSLQELLGKLARGEGIAGHLVITFDDGYRDNEAVAASVLHRYGLPASFFIATEFIGSDRVSWWDAELGISSEWMTWDQVRRLAAGGFDVGVHTRNHVDLGQVTGPEAEAEIIGATDRLERELGARPRLFSYPYGRENQMTEEGRTIVRQGGLACCVSAFGGVVAPANDPFHLRRTPISPWYESPYQFGFETMLER